MRHDDLRQRATFFALLDVLIVALLALLWWLNNVVYRQP